MASPVSSEHCQQVKHGVSRINLMVLVVMGCAIVSLKDRITNMCEEQRPTIGSWNAGNSLYYY